MHEDAIRCAQSQRDDLLRAIMLINLNGQLIRIQDSMFNALDDRFGGDVYTCGPDASVW